MSFQVNNNELKKIYFNGQSVNTVYYYPGDGKMYLVWENAIKFETASWDEIRAICVNVQKGIQAWPDYIKLGAVKTLNLSVTVLGTNVMYARVIGIDVDGPGTLTFQIFAGGRAKNTVYTEGALNEIPFNKDPMSGVWIGSDARQYCQDIYKYCDAKNAIKVVKKYTTPSYSSSQAITPVMNEETVWLPSTYELGLVQLGGSANASIKECTYIEETGEYSEPYPYCSSTEYRSYYLYPEDDEYHYGAGLSPMTRTVMGFDSLPDIGIYEFTHGTFDSDEINQTPDPDVFLGDDYSPTFYGFIDSTTECEIAPCFVIG